jgi:UDP-N-acetylmuramoyl-tripeptide--D-alanyl-D-alanine ligase
VADFPHLMTISQLAKAVGGKRLCDFAPQKFFSSVATDSRNVLPGSLFIPLRGEFQDGHIYIPQAVKAGASVVIIDSTYAETEKKSLKALGKNSAVTFVQVENTLQALQDAARMYVSFFPDLLKIGITGSSGKTTTKEIAGSIFSKKYRVVLNEGNLNSETGLPLSVFKIRKEHEVGIFELGMNRRGEIAEIARVLSPSLALITNVGTAHIGILGTQRAIAEEKKAIFSFFGENCAGFIPEDDPWREYLSHTEAGSVFEFGPTQTIGYEGHTDLGIDGTRIRYEGLEINFPLPGSYNLKNALAGITLARFAGLSSAQIQAGLEDVKPLFGRTEVLRGDITVLLDCYNANPASMESAIEFSSNVSWKGKRIFILGSMLELGEESDAAHREICRFAAASRVDSIFLYGDDIIHAGRCTEWGSIEIRFFSDIDALGSELIQTVHEGDLVLIKGSRGMALERILPALAAFGKLGLNNG